MKNSFLVNYDTKELTLHFKGDTFSWNLNDGDVGEFWHSFETTKGVVKDINFHQEDENDIPTFAVYGVTKDDEGFDQINTDDEIIVKGKAIGNPMNYFYEPVVKPKTKDELIGELTECTKLLVWGLENAVYNATDIQDRINRLSELNTQIRNLK